jgi:hypothetical protein
LFFSITLLFSCPRHALGWLEDPGFPRPPTRTA